MQYTSDGLEIQYRECQILRDAAKKVIHETSYDNIEMNDLLEKIRQSCDGPKKEYGDSLIKILPNLTVDYYKGLLEYIFYLAEKERGIDIMTPFYTKNNMVILPVNRHRYEILGEES